MFQAFSLQVLCCSSELKCTMKFGVYLPPAAEGSKVPVLYWLSGELCSVFVSKHAWMCCVQTTKNCIILLYQMKAFVINIAPAVAQ